MSLTQTLNKANLTLFDLFHNDTPGREMDVLKCQDISDIDGRPSHNSLRCKDYCVIIGLA